MRAYLAIIRDSFHEAIASRVLWILFAGITLLLVVLFPISVSSEPASRIQRSEMRNGAELIKDLQKIMLKENDTSAQGYVVSKLSEKIQHRISKIDEIEGVRSYYELIHDLRLEWNDLLKETSFYQEKYWKTSSLSDEAKKLIKIKKEDRSDTQTARLNRILMEETFPKNLKTVQKDAIYVAYFGYKVGETLPFPPSYVEKLLNRIIRILMLYLSGILGVSIGIMVTSPIIPNMFEPGSIDLLLSKPVSRSILFLSRFAGACSFMLLITSYLILGIWLIAGLRFDLWNSNLILCIPVFIFLFMIYYSVSALAGVIWRNPIVSVVLTLAFWCVCFTLGTAKFLFEEFLLPTAVTSVISVDQETLISVNRKKEAFEWKDSENKWEKVFHEPNSWANSFSLLSPVYDPENQRLITVRIPRSRYQLLGGFGNVMIGKKKNDWNLTQGVDTPANTFYFFQTPEKKFRIVSLSGVYEFDGDISQEKKSFKILGFNLAPKSGTGGFKKISPEVSWNQPVSVSAHPVNGDLLVYEEGKIHFLSLNESGNYKILKSAGKKNSSNNNQDPEKIISALGNDVGLLAFENGEIKILKTEDLSELKTFKPFQVSDKPHNAIVSPDGKWIVVTSRNRKMWLFDIQKQEPVTASWTRQQDVVSANFTPQETLLVIDLFGHTVEYQPESGELIKYRDPPAEISELLYTALIRPLYTIFPSPGELDKLVTHLLVDPMEVSKIHRNDSQDIRHSDFDKIWEPVWSCLAFLVVMLTGTCIYVSRRDF